MLFVFVCKPVHVHGKSDMDSDGFQCLLVDGINYCQDTLVKCGMPGMAGSITEALMRVGLDEV